MIEDNKVFKNQDLVFKISPNIDPEMIDINKYVAFLDALCVEREYQKEVKLGMIFHTGHRGSDRFLPGLQRS